MGKYTKADILRMVKEDDVEFIRLQFTDIFGDLKNVAITSSQIEKALDNKIMFDGSSIEGFVLSVDNENNFIKNPKVRVNSRKNKCLVYVEGEILPSDNIIKRTQSIKDEIGNGLTQFFGLNHGVKLDVSVKDYKPKKPTKKTVSRVK